MSTTGRISTAPNRASANRAVISTARSSLAQSTTMYPASCSFASTYGPSVTAGRPSRTRTVRLCIGAPRAVPPTSSPLATSSSRNASVARTSSARSASGSARNSGACSKTGCSQFSGLL
jgi:hypothetical protein